ncbi:hypothetical protein COW36_14455 [bacterium (Candidatus Blackallbacteria) CG17_big_fil_post_rev_8_21_14_2_50_48_46]|uniref:DUF885 domain-containing protein n=1 Tax=bacterium (Candidatus Blackallbacteria) CG17_big_fil_post_rev_8_21_14_2_50_48_46 TaxID=2014261 RepID=A0A2M7G2X8_9BACT|nr:MAG: hypothetical protein COW64_08980 [bacterium (Candidatus Blackallbacteria) CG18_big_fil_WC_8_21_14_2_50_49_26]PIW16162.1 MAG: hypothetical protein COW36_14455 [bacterium (Candidatus Blackallbacteria) CG17_big_fil_post_rev_8_21_14_2_50_48_46]PIW44249.1 MAG: hypothetical protein COW20_24785 [bacterium (Candidatus Blackallbacteria) CG13_big_fil_rev_8_21_14_2_50_49_14]
MTESALPPLAEQILRFLYETDPVNATGLGIHDYDYHYADFSPEKRAEILKQKKAFLQELKALEESHLSSEDQVDLSILQSQLSTQIYEEEVRENLKRDPSLYPTEALYGVQQLQINYNLPLDHRVLAIIGRLKAMPRLFEQGMANLRSNPSKISKVSISVARDSVMAGRQFLEEIVPQFSGTVPHYFKDLLESNTQALKALHHYQKFLDELEPQAQDSLACGKEHFDFLLRNKYQLDYHLDEVLEIGREALKETERLIAEVAQELNPGKTWREQVEELKNKHPEADNLLQAYKAEAERIRDFVVSENLVTLPETETLALMDTPIFQRSIMPYSGYVSPAAFEDHQTGYFWVTPVQDSLSDEDKHKHLRSHNIYDVTLTTVHHGYPGQHLLFVQTHQHPSRVRNSFPDPFLASGWPLYCEEMLYTEGLYTDLNTRLFQLKDQLWRDYRVIIDTQLHLGQMDYETAVQTLVEKVGLDPASAEAEVKRYALFPTIAIGYMFGKREIIRMRQEIAELKGDDFSLLKFHNNLLSFGMLPLSQLRRLMLTHYGLEA